MNLMNMELYKKMQFDSDVYLKLLEAERQATEMQTRYSSSEVLKALKQVIASDV